MTLTSDETLIDSARSAWKRATIKTRIISIVIMGSLCIFGPSHMGNFVAWGYQILFHRISESSETWIKLGLAVFWGFFSSTLLIAFERAIMDERIANNKIFQAIHQHVYKYSDTHGLAFSVESFLRDYYGDSYAKHILGVMISENGLHVLRRDLMPTGLPDRIGSVRIYEHAIGDMFDIPSDSPLKLVI